MLRQVSQTELLQTAKNRNLVLVDNFREKRRDLLQQPINRVLAASLEERGNGQRRDGSIGVTNQGFQSLLQLDTTRKWEPATAARVRMEANRTAGLGELKKS